MIIKQSFWTPKRYLEEKHPEFTAIRNIVTRNPQHQFILVGYGLKYEHFRVGSVLFYNIGLGSTPKFALAFFQSFWLPLLLRPSVIVAMGGINIVPTAIASMFTRAKLVSVVADLYSISEFPRVLARPFRWFLRASFNKSSAILAISNSISCELRNDYHVVPGKCLVYTYRISGIFNPGVPKDLRNALNPVGPIVLTVCRIVPMKGLGYLVEASRAVVEKIPNVKFVIRAYRSEREYESRIREQIRQYRLERNFKILIEFSDYEQLPKYMAAADVFVLPSVTEGLGVVLLEAMASGVPVIGSNVAGIRDVIDHGYNGLLVEAGDTGALSTAIIRLLFDESLRRRLSAGGLSTVASVREDEFESLLTHLMFGK